MRYTRWATALALGTSIAACGAPSQQTSSRPAPGTDEAYRTLSHISSPWSSRRNRPRGVGAGDVLLCVWANGVLARQGGAGPEGFSSHLSFSIWAEQNAQGRIRGVVFLCDAMRDPPLSRLGDIDDGTVSIPLPSQADSGDRSAWLEGRLIDGRPFTLALTDVHTHTSPGARRPEGLALSLAGQEVLRGEVVNGNIRIVGGVHPRRTIRTSQGVAFDPQVGLWLFTTPFNELAGGPTFAGSNQHEGFPSGVLEVPPPDPRINFRINDPGGQHRPPGSENNMPNVGPQSPG